MFADPEKIDKGDILRMKVLHFECILKYAKIASEEFEEGRKNLRREFMKKVYID